MDLNEFVQRQWATKNAFTASLVPLSYLYAAGWIAYCEAHRHGLLKSRSGPCRAICVGNLAAGGTGKTPVCIHLVSVLAGMGHEVVLSTSGYGAAHYEDAALAPAGALNPSEWGDESSLLRWRLPGIPIVVGRRRAQAAQIVKAKHPRAVMLMDDGFQHVQFRPSATILLDPDSVNSWCFPAGPYREPQQYGRRRANKVVPRDFRVTRSETVLSDPSGLPHTLRGDVDVLCAVANPGSVLAGLTAMGLNIVETRILGDHDPLSDPRILAGLGEKRPIVVTAKDFVKLRPSAVARKDVVVADYQAMVEPAAELAKWLRTILDERLD